MMRAMTDGITGLQAFQQQMDVIGNNIANVNTVGFKASRADFQNLFYQTMAAASAPTKTQGGTNPSQIGLGTQIGSVQQLMGQGSLQQTGVNTDLAVNGNGFFIVQGGSGQPLYTRNGAFSVDSNGNLVTQGGQKVLGWQSGTNGAPVGSMPALTAGNLTGLQIPLNLTSNAQSTSAVTVTGNLNLFSSQTTLSTQVTVYDSLGDAVPVTLDFTKTGSTTAGTTWQWSLANSSVTIPAGSSSSTYTINFSGGTSGSLGFNTNGQLTSGGATTLTWNSTSYGASAGTISLDFGIPSVGTGVFTGFTDVSNPSTFAYTQNGDAAGNLTGYNISQGGVISGVFSNGQQQTLGQVALADFSNPAGLTGLAGGLYGASPNAGPAQVGASGTGNLGTILPGTLENSNVSLATEFTNMIQAERAFQANAQVITTSSSLLQTLVQLMQ